MPHLRIKRFIGLSCNNSNASLHFSERDLWACPICKELHFNKRVEQVWHAMDMMLYTVNVIMH